MKIIFTVDVDEAYNLNGRNLITDELCEQLSRACEQYKGLVGGLTCDWDPPWENSDENLVHS